MSTISLQAAQRLVFETRSLGGTVPDVFTNILGLIETVKTAPPVPDPAAGLIDAAANGRAGTAAELQKLVAASAKAEAEAACWRRLQADVARDAAKRFGQELRNGGADHFLDSFRPGVVDLAKQLDDAKSVVDVNLTPEQLVASATPEQLAAYRLLPELLAKVDQIARLVAGFGPGGDFAAIDEPGSNVQLRGVRNEALFMTALDWGRASEVVIARMADWRTSPWLRLPLKLATVAEAKEKVRAVAEAEWEYAQGNYAAGGRLTADGFVPEVRINPFAVREASESTEPEASAELEKV